MIPFAPEIDQIPSLIRRTLDTPEWAALAYQFGEAETVILFGNGGNLAIAGHAASDMSRITGKHCISPANLSSVTSLVTSGSPVDWISDWISESLGSARRRTIAIGLSCSRQGVSSQGVENGCNRSVDGDIPTFLFCTGKRGLNQAVTQIVIDTDYYHVAELTYMTLVYQLIASGHALPQISTKR